MAQIPSKEPAYGDRIVGGYLPGTLAGTYVLEGAIDVQGALRSGGDALSWSEAISVSKTVNFANNGTLYFGTGTFYPS